jgi:hypothetical protein
MAFDGKLGLPISSNSVPLVHGTPISVREDFLSGAKEHRAKKCVFVAN